MSAPCTQWGPLYTSIPTDLLTLNCPKLPHVLLSSTTVWDPHNVTFLSHHEEEEWTADINALYAIQHNGTENGI